MAETMNTYTALATQSGQKMVPEAYYSKALLKMIMLNDFVFMKYGVMKPLPKNYGTTMNFRRYNKLEPKTTALTEGVPPTPDTASGTALTASVKQYGAYMIFTDLAEDELFDNVVKEYLMAQAQQASLTLDNMVKTELETNGSPMYASGDSYANMVVEESRPTIDLFRKAALTMSTNFIMPHEQGGGNYVALVDDNIMYDLADDEKVNKYMQYGNTNKPMVENWIADMYGLRFIRNRNVSSSQQTLKDSQSHTVHNAFVLGAEAYAVVKLGGKDVQVYIKGLGSAGTTDPLNQKQTIGWKIQGFTAKVLTPMAVQRIICLPTNE